MVVYCENMYDVQLSSQLLLSQLHVRSFKSFWTAVEWFINRRGRVVTKVVRSYGPTPLLYKIWQ